MEGNILIFSFPSKLFERLYLQSIHEVEKSAITCGLYVINIKNIDRLDKRSTKGTGQ
jgi:hypothetical protein